MTECFKCGVSDKNVQLFEVITKEGIVKMCDGCLMSEDSPILRKPTKFQLKEIERKPTVYERLSKMSGLKIPNESKVAKTDFLIKQETSLRAIVDKNYTETAKHERKLRPELVDNFNWIIMRARRDKRVTRKQMAEAIGEAEAAIKMAEGGVLPENNYLLNKIQTYLKINLFRDENRVIPETIVSASVPEPIFDRKNPINLKIADLKKMKDEKENKEVKKEVKKDDSDLSEEEIHNLIFKK